MNATQRGWEAFAVSHGLWAATIRSGLFATGRETLTPAIEMPTLQLQDRASQTLNHRFKSAHL